MKPSILRSRHVVSAVVAALVGASCTPLLESSIDKCKKDSDCTSIGKSFANSYCDVDRGLCVAEASAETKGCQSNKECRDQNDGRLSICRKSDGRCVEIKSPECPDVNPDNEDAKEEDAVFIGTILPRRSQTEGVADTARAFEEVMDLARNEILLDVNGLPPLTSGGKRRPIVLVHCDEENLKDGVKQGAKPSAQHLIDLEIPAIIGAYYSGASLTIGTDITDPQKTLLISPASNSPALKDSITSNDPRLFWRTVPNDEIQGDVVPRVVSTIIEPKLREKLGPNEQLRVAIVHRGDTAGVRIAGAVKPNLFYNGKSAIDNGENYRQLDYGNPSTDTLEVSLPKREGVKAKLLEFRPHIAIAVGATAEVIENVFEPLEQQWPDDERFRPFYLLANNTLQTKRTVSFINNCPQSKDLRHRIVGHIAGSATPEVSNLQTLFEGKYSSNWAGSLPFPYDAFYMIAMAIAATGKEPLTGVNVARSMSLLNDTSAPKIKVGVGNITTAFDRLLAGESINLEGVSGHLDFDEKTGEAVSDIQIWCPTANESGVATGYHNSGLYYDATEHKLSGTFNCP